MKTTGLAKYAGVVAALAICSACGGGSAVAPSNAALDSEYVGRTVSANAELSTAARPNPSRLPRYPTVVPEPSATSGPYYEYVINFYASYASVFDYPNSVKQIGTIGNVGGQGCTNVLHGYGKRTFWIVAGAHNINEYKVPQTFIRSLSVSDGS